MRRTLAFTLALCAGGCAWDRGNSPAAKSAALSAPMPVAAPIVSTGTAATNVPMPLPPISVTPSVPEQPAISGVVLASANIPLSPPTTAGTVPEQIAAGSVLPSGPQRFGIGELEGMALANNPTLAQASARVQAARGNWQQVGRYPNPIVGYQGVEIGNEGKAGQQGMYLEQEFVTGKKLGLSQNAAAQAVRQAEQEYEAQRLRVINDLRIAFFDILVSQRRMEIAQELLGVGEKGMNATDQLLKAKEVSQADLLQARIELNSARIQNTNSQASYQANWRKIAAVIGVPGLTPVQLTGDLDAACDEITWENALGNVLNNSPELAAAYAGADRARWALSRERAEPIPNIDVQLTMQHDNATTSDIAGVQAVLPIPLFNRNRGNIARADAELSVAQREINRLQLDLQHRLAITFGRYTMAKQAMERYRQEILPDARRSLDLVSEGYKQGEYSFLGLLTAQRTFFQTNNAYLDAIRDLQESRVAIEGLLLTGSLNSSAAPAEEPQSTTYGVVPVMGRL